MRYYLSMKTLKLCMLFAVLLMAKTSFSDDWICHEESSVRVGGAYGTINSCGIGEAKNEPQARILAFKNAKAEFNQICQTSVDCHGHNVTVEPARTECESSGDGYKCYRLIRFHIQQIHNEQVAENDTYQIIKKKPHQQTMAESAMSYANEIAARYAAGDL